MSHKDRPEDNNVNVLDVPWLMWYFWLQDRFLNEVMQGRTLITDSITSDFSHYYSTGEPPVGLEGKTNNLVASYVRINRTGAVLFAIENLQAYMLHDLMVGDGKIAPLPFGIDEEMFCSWGLLDKGDYQRLVNVRLGIS